MNESPAPASSASASPASASASPLAAPWLSGPLRDLLLGCGLLALPLAFASDLAARTEATLTITVIAALSLFLSGPHFAAALLRAFRAGGSTRQILLGTGVVAVLAIVSTHANPALLPWLFTAFLTLSPWHYAAQNHRIGLVLLARAGSSPTTATTTTTTPVGTAEATALRLAHAAFAAAAVVATHTGPREAMVVRFGLTPSGGFTVVVVCVVVAAVAAVFALWRLRRRGLPLRALLLVCALLSTSIVWFAVPALVGAGGSLAYAGGVVALLHGAQYLWLTSFAAARAAFFAKRSFDGFAWFGAIVALGVALFTLLPWVLSKAAGFDLVISLLTFQAVLSLHHYGVDLLNGAANTDSRLWSGNERAPADRQRVSNARAVAWSVPMVLLFLVGVVDVLQTAGTRPDASEALAIRAAVLNESDSRVWVQSAQLAANANDLDSAKADLGRALALSPWNADAQRALARLHIAAGRDDEAWARYQAMPRGLADDPDSLVLFGSVAQRMGERGQVPVGAIGEAGNGANDDYTLVAESMARQALVHLDGSHTIAEIEARGVLGAALLVQKKSGDARTELKRAVDEAQDALGYDPIARGQLLDIGLDLAAANVALKQIDPALALYERCLEGAGKANRADVAFRALAGRARIFDERGRAHDSLQAWQQALSFVDDVTGDPGAVAEAWLDYASLLARSEAPMRVRYACGLKARAAAEKMPAGKRREERLKFITDATRYVEEVLPAADAEAVRKDVDAAAKAALELAYPGDDAPDEGAADDAPAVPPALTP